jgi:transcriptional regulator with XRE-family HTH domain
MREAFVNRSAFRNQSQSVVAGAIVCRAGVESRVATPVAYSSRGARQDALPRRGVTTIGGFSPRDPASRDGESREPSSRDLSAHDGSSRAVSSREAASAAGPSPVRQDAPAAFTPARESADSILAKNLVAARLIAGVTQRELADAAGISRATVAQIETGSSDPRLSTIVELASALGLPASALLFGRLEVRAIVELPDRAAKPRPALDTRDVVRMRQHLGTGMLKDRLRAARIGANAVESTSASPLGPIVSALFSAVIPGGGTEIGSIFGDLLAERPAASPPEKY